MVFSRTQPNTRKYFSKHFLKYNKTLENIFISGKYFTWTKHSLNMLRKMTLEFRNYKSCKFNINLIILHISSQEEHLVRWSWFQSRCLQGERAQVRILVAVFFFNFSLFHDQLNPGSSGFFLYSMTNWTGLRFNWFFGLNPGLSGSLRNHVYLILS